MFFLGVLVVPFRSFWGGGARVCGDGWVLESGEGGEGREGKGGWVYSLVEYCFYFSETFSISGLRGQ